MKRKHTIFKEDGSINQEITIPLTADSLGVVLEDFSRPLAKLEEYNPRQINFSNLYEILHEISPTVFDLRNPVMFDENIEDFVISHSKISDKYLQVWFTEYTSRSNYYNHLTEGVDKYNFWGHKTGILTKEDIDIKLEYISKDFFADPTYDSTFKMLFASEKHKNLLIDFANSLLGFTEEEKIVEVRLEREETPPLGQYGINSAVDVLCTTADGKTIALEMQRKHEDYFLSRTQYYMSKLFVTAMQKGFSDQYHKMIDKVYMIIIGKDAIFEKGIGLDNQYEFTITPTIEELNQTVPDNKMYWKFFELKRFKKLCNNGEMEIDESSPKYNVEKWLRFLLECGKQDKVSIPDNTPEIIKEAYKIMETANMAPQEYLRYQDEKMHEYFEKLEHESSIRKAEEDLNNALAKGEAKGEAKGKAEGLAEGIVKGEAKGLVSKLQSLLKFTEDPKSLAEETGFSQEQIQELIADRERLPQNALQMLGFDHDLLAVQGSEDIQISGDTDVLTESSLM